MGVIRPKTGLKSKLATLAVATTLGANLFGLKEVRAKIPKPESRRPIPAEVQKVDVSTLDANRLKDKIDLNSYCDNFYKFKVSNGGYNFEKIMTNVKDPILRDRLMKYILNKLVLENIPSGQIDIIDGARKNLPEKYKAYLDIIIKLESGIRTRWPESVLGAMFFSFDNLSPDTHELFLSLVNLRFWSEENTFDFRKLESTVKDPKFKDLLIKNALFQIVFNNYSIVDSVSPGLNATLFEEFSEEMEYVYAQCPPAYLNYFANLVGTAKALYLFPVKR
jgi:hypothetical protein